MKALRRKRFYSKLRGDSAIGKMTSEQRETLVKWLFEENVTFREAISRCASEFNIRLPKKGLELYYRKMAQRRNIECISSNTEYARRLLEAMGGNPERVYEAMVGIAADAAFRAANPLEPGVEPDLKPLLDTLPLLMDARQDAREMQKAALERERWEFDVVRMCHRHLAELQAIVADDSLDEHAQLEAIRLRIFGRAMGEVSQLKIEKEKLKIGDGEGS